MTLIIFVTIGPCKMMVPVLETIAGKFENEMKVAKVDTDKSPKVSYLIDF
jgi:thioredoxin-like negative regulator of GroEL